MVLHHLLSVISIKTLIESLGSFNDLKFLHFYIY